MLCWTYVLLNCLPIVFKIIYKLQVDQCKCKKIFSLQGFYAFKQTKVPGLYSKALNAAFRKTTTQIANTIVILKVRQRKNMNCVTMILVTVLVLSILVNGTNMPMVVCMKEIRVSLP